jgi:RNA polymerase sigma factor for flagellar operon FliA
MNATAREETIREFFPLVRAIARRLQHVARAADLDDLVGDGAVGLIRAVDTFDAARGTTLDAYARRLIVGAMLNGLRRLDPVSERVRRTLRRAETKRYALAQERGTLPAYGELERDDAALRRARAIAHRQAALSLDAPFGVARDGIPDRGAEPAERALARIRNRELAEAVALLPERQRRIVRMHYGGEQSLHAIGSTMRVSPQRVSQLHLEALAQLRRTVLPA